jgi:membrane-bound lytic murein transglycosylase D
MPTPFVYDIPIVRNAAVDRWIDYFTGPARERFSIWLRRSGRYMPTFRRVLRENKLPEDLAYLPLIESGFSLRARSRAGAVGPWQFMRGTARRNGLKVNRYLDERRDPVKATQAAATYLSALYAEFGDWHLALAAYNSGENRVRRVLRRTGQKTYWAIARTRRLPNETRNYIPKFLAGMIIAKNPEVFGFAGIDYDEPLRYETVALPRGMSLRHAARLAGAPLKEMADLNAELRWYVTPPVSGHLLRLPPGSAQRFLDALSRSPQESFPAKGRYRILPGDTLGSLAARFGVSLKGLLEVNAHLDPRRLRVGTEILLPGRAAKRSRASARSRAKISTGGAALPPRGRYRIRSGDTLGGIAQRFGLTLKDISGLNPGIKSKYLRVGSEIRLPGPPARPGRKEMAKASFVETKKTNGASGASGANGTGAADRSGPALNGKASKSHHTVSSGESVWIISKRYGVPSRQILRLNGLKPSTRIFPGTRLRIRP